MASTSDRDNITVTIDINGDTILKLQDARLFIGDDLVEYLSNIKQGGEILPITLPIVISVSAKRIELTKVYFHDKNDRNRNSRL